MSWVRSYNPYLQLNPFKWTEKDKDETRNSIYFRKHVEGKLNEGYYLSTFIFTMGWLLWND